MIDHERDPASLMMIEARLLPVDGEGVKRGDQSSWTG